MGVHDDAVTCPGCDESDSILSYHEKDGDLHVLCQDCGYVMVVGWSNEAVKEAIDKYEQATDVSDDEHVTEEADDRQD